MVVDFSILLAYSDLFLILGLVALWRISLRIAPPIDMGTDASRIGEEYNAVLQNKGRGKLITHVVEGLKASAASEWSVTDADNWTPERQAEAKGFVRPPHPALELYKVKKYMKNWSARQRHPPPTSEDFVFLDPELEPEYENVNPGTVTVEGFGIECWAFEEYKPKDLQIYVNHARLPYLKPGRLLRRWHELSDSNPALSSDPLWEELELQDMVDGDYGADDKARWVLELYGFLNCLDVFTDWAEVASIGSHLLSSSDMIISTWDFLRQVILAKELATRLQTVERADNFTGFTWRVLSSLIVSDLFAKNVRMVIVDTTLNLDGVPIPDAAQRAQAEKFNTEGDKAINNQKYQEAFDAYQEAIKIDLRSSLYRTGRSYASLVMKNFPEAEEDALGATILDPKHERAWTCLAEALSRQGQTRRAERAYEKGLAIAHPHTRPAFATLLAEARDQTQRTLSSIEAEPNPAQRHRRRSEFLAQDFDMAGKDIEWHSRVHQQQVDGLLCFAQRIKWPYLDETRRYAEGVYARVRAGEGLDIHLWDWLFGLVFPGKWFALKIMGVLVLCSPTLRDRGTPPNYGSGLALPDRTYVRGRTVLARVLGCLPSVVSLCGWVGPLPALVFEEPVDQSKPRYVRFKAQTKPPLMPAPTFRGLKLIGPSMEEAQMMMKRPGETPSAFIRDIKDPKQWTLPTPPARDTRSYRLKEVRVRKVPGQIDTSILDQIDAEGQAEYRASLLFEFDAARPIVTYQLFTVPIFVTLPPCRSPRLHEAGPGVHEFHKREISLFEGKIWSVGELKNYTSSVGYGGVTVINATGEGAEAVARAWCSEVGRNATIRKPGGPCFVCALRATSSSALRVGVLIWVG